MNPEKPLRSAIAPPSETHREDDISTTPHTDIPWVGSTRDRCIAVARAHLPTNVKTVLPALGPHGAAYFKEGIMLAPRPTSRKGLYIFLHECAHFHLHAGHRKARYIEEYEAERWAHARMKEAGIPVPRCMTVRAKEYVREMILKAVEHGANRILTDTVRWSVVSLNPCVRPLLSGKHWLPANLIPDLVSA